MRRTLGILVLLVGLSAVPSFVSPAAAEHRHDRYCRHGSYGYSHAYHPNYRDSAWEIVRRDPCRWAEFQDFAARHKNPNKRRRFVERLAREGCEDGRRSGYRYGSYHDHDGWYRHDNSYPLTRFTFEY